MTRVDRIAALAREPVAVDAVAVDRTATAIHAAGAPRTGRLRALVLTPAGLLLLVVVSFLAGLVTARSLAPSHAAAGPDGVMPVTFVLVSETARRVSLVGDFNDWSPGRTQLDRRAGGVWTVVVPLAPGRYSYAFVLDDGTWLADPGAPPAVEEDFGRPGSVVVVERATL